MQRSEQNQQVSLVSPGQVAHVAAGSQQGGYLPRQRQKERVQDYHRANIVRLLPVPDNALFLLPLLLKRAVEWHSVHSPSVQRRRVHPGTAAHPVFLEELYSTLVSL